MSATTEIQTGADESGAIIRADTRGRARYDAAFRQRVLHAYVGSGMSAMAFARHCGVKYPTLAAWVRKARPSPPPPPAAVREQDTTKPRFLVAEVAAAGSAVRDRAGRLELEVAPGMVARVDDVTGVALLADLVRNLRQLGGASSC
jgi:transposase-like protein